MVVPSQYLLPEPPEVLSYDNQGPSEPSCREPLPGSTHLLRDHHSSGPEELWGGIREAATGCAQLLVIRLR